jgi:hypothetical protein
MMTDLTCEIKLLSIDWGAVLDKAASDINIYGFAAVRLPFQVGYKGSFGPVQFIEINLTEESIDG